MTEQLLKDQFELSKRNAERAEWERISSLQEVFAVLKTNFDNHCKQYETHTSNAVGAGHLTALKQEVETNMIQHFQSANAQQSADLMNRVEGMFVNYRDQQNQQQLAALRELLEANKHRGSRWLWWVLGIVGGLIVSVGSIFLGIVIAGAMK